MIKGIISTSSDRTTHSETSVSTEKRESHDCLVENHEAESKPGVKSNVSEELQPALDSGKSGKILILNKRCVETVVMYMYLLF